MSIKVTSDRGNEKIFAEISGIDRSFKRATRQGWFELGKDLKSSASREILRKNKTGRTYTIRSRSGRTRRHVASAPGETHANLSGALRKSISWKVFGFHSMDFGYGVSTTSINAAPPYGPFVEFGTVKMEARPSLENAINATQRNAEGHFRRALNRELGK